MVAEMEFRTEDFEQHYEALDEIGSGQFAVVRRCRCLESGEEFAAKFIRKKRAKASRRGQAREDIEREVAILCLMNHDNIIKLREVYESNHEIILVLELVPGGELFEFLAERDKATEMEAVAFIKQILLGVKHMHDQQVAHLDLKPENVLLKERGQPDVKLIDFGLSRKLDQLSEVREMLGTAEFVAPEVISYDPLTLATDMWAVGVITYILLTGYSPFLGEDKQETFANVSCMNYSLESSMFEGCSTSGVDFIRHLLVQAPENRFSVDQALQHQWILGQGHPEASVELAPKLGHDVPDTMPTSLPSAQQHLSPHQQKETNGNDVIIPPVVLSNGDVIDENESTVKEKKKLRTDKKLIIPPASGQSFSSFVGTQSPSALDFKLELRSLELVQMKSVVEENEDDVAEVEAELHDDADEQDNVLNKVVKADLNSAEGEQKTPFKTENNNNGHIEENGEDIDLFDLVENNLINSDSITDTGSSNHENDHGDVTMEDVDDSENGDLNYAVAELNNSVKDDIEHISVSQRSSVVQMDENCRQFQNGGANQELTKGFEEEKVGRTTGIRDRNTEDSPQEVAVNSLFKFCEEGDLAALQQLLDDDETNLDVNVQNQRGENCVHVAASAGHVTVLQELKSRGAHFTSQDSTGNTAVYGAARQGQVEALSFLLDVGCEVDTRNSLGEAALQVAVRYGQNDVIARLLAGGASVNLQDEVQETALHVCAWHGLPSSICSMLVSAGGNVNIQNKDGETPLHCAALRGNSDLVRALVQCGADLNALDRRHQTAFALTVRRANVGLGLMLLHAGCAMDTQDAEGDTPLHLAAAHGLLPLVQTMCAFGCRVDIVDKRGESALHRACRAGHLEVVRCLLLSGAAAGQENGEGVAPEVVAIAQCRPNIAQLLAGLKPERREMCIKQLMPSSDPLPRIKLKVLGPSASGKSTLVDSLKCGYFGSFFRKARLSSTSSATRTESDSDWLGWLWGAPTKNGDIELEEMGYAGENGLTAEGSMERAHDAYTKGIEVQQISVSGPGDLSAWEFSGYEPYLPLYEHFIGDTSCVHALVWSLQTPPDEALGEVLWWMRFLRSRLPPMEPIGPGGSQPLRARVLLVATHADKVNAPRNPASGEYESPHAQSIVNLARQKFGADLDIAPRVYVLDAHLATSPEIKSLRAQLSVLKKDIVQALPCTNGFVDAVVTGLARLRAAAPQQPVLPWPAFVAWVREKVNMLASEEHLKQLMHQLQLMGEVVYVEGGNWVEQEDLVVYNPHWLGNQILGELFAHSSLATTRPTGCFTMDDFQLVCAEGDSTIVLQLLESLEICTRCEVDDDTEWEFPGLNQIETLSGLWELDSERLPADLFYAGLRLQCTRGVDQQLVHAFARAQVKLRRHLLREEQHTDDDLDLYQWRHGSKFCQGNMEALVTLERGAKVVDVKVRGPTSSRSALFDFWEDVVLVVLGSLSESCPGLALDRGYFSPRDLKAHKQQPRIYPASEVLSAQRAAAQDAATPLPSITLGDNEPLEEVLFCGCGVQWKAGVAVGVDALPLATRRALCGLLDAPHPSGLDWCLMAVRLGLSAALPALNETTHALESRTDRALAEWALRPEATVGALIDVLEDMGRQDAADAVLSGAPVYSLLQHPAAPAAEDDVTTAETNGARAAQLDHHQQQLEAVEEIAEEAV